jgi:hypothetical protein
LDENGHGYSDDSGSWEKVTRSLDPNHQQTQQQPTHSHEIEMSMNQNSLKPTQNNSSRSKKPYTVSQALLSSRPAAIPRLENPATSAYNNNLAMNRMILNGNPQNIPQNTRSDADRMYRESHGYSTARYTHTSPNMYPRERIDPMQQMWAANPFMQSGEDFDMSYPNDNSHVQNQSWSY